MASRILNEKLIYQGRIYKLTADEVEFDDGSKGLRDILHLAGASCILPILNDDTVILVEQYRHAVEDRILEIPAGMIDPDEDALLAASRELEEETGYRCHKIKHLTSFYPTPGVVRETLHLYVATDLEKSEQHLDADEFLDVKKVSFAQLDEMIKTGEIKDGKTMLAYLFYKTYLRNNKEL